MNDNRIDAASYSKLFVFLVLSLPSIFFFLLGFIPAAFLVIGIVMLNKTGNFSHVEKSVVYYKKYFLIAFVLGLLFLVGAVFVDQPRAKDIPFVIAVFGMVIAAYFAHIALVRYLYLEPLKAHKKWVEANGFLSRAGRNGELHGESGKHSKDQEGNIMKGKRPLDFSVAGELLKWSELLEKGAITQEEFDRAKCKLMQ